MTKIPQICSWTLKMLHSHFLASFIFIGTNIFDSSLFTIAHTPLSSSLSYNKQKLYVVGVVIGVVVKTVLPCLHQPPLVIVAPTPHWNLCCWKIHIPSPSSFLAALIIFCKPPFSRASSVKLQSLQKKWHFAVCFIYDTILCF